MIRKDILWIGILLFWPTWIWGQHDSIVFSSPGGFYDTVFSLELFNTQPENHIRYTTNGNDPTAHSPRYTEPLTLDERMYSQSKIYTICNCPQDQFVAPDSVLHCIVIRAAAFNAEDSCVSPYYTHSYFIHELGCDLHGLPAMSLCVDSLDLFDYDNGIFIPGAYYDSLRPRWSGNYSQRGKQWERLANFEFYESDNQGINQLCGVRTHGGNGRRFQQKTLKVFARNKYGLPSFNYPFFGNQEINQFRVLVLRPFLSSNGGCEDYLCNRLAEQMGIDCMPDRPSVLFINGEYWGIYYLKERLDQHYIENHYGYNHYDVNLFLRWKGGMKNGNPERFNTLFTWMTTADLTDPQQYSHADAYIDIDNFIDYHILEMFIANFDWPANNVKFWQAGDSKYRWCFFDGDACLEKWDFDVFANAVYDGEDSYPSNRKSTLFFRKLLENKKFQYRFAERFNHWITTTLSYNNTKHLFQGIKDILEGEAHRQFDRFPQMESYYPKDHDDWLRYHLERTRQFLEQRPACNFLSMPQPSTDFTYQWMGQGWLMLRIKADRFGSTLIEIWDQGGESRFSQCCVLASGMNTVYLNTNLPVGIYQIRIGNHTDPVTIVP